MKKYSTPSILLFLFIAWPALKAQKSVYTMPFENTLRLPAMETAVNIEEIAATYQTMGSLYTTEITGIGEEPMEQVSTTRISDVKVVDAIRFLEFYMEDQLLDPALPPQGLVEMSVIYFDQDSRWNAGSALGILTFGVSILLGIPHSTAVVDVEVQASFYDEALIPVTTCRGVGRGKRLLTLYSQSGERKAHQKALKKALLDLNEKILQDPSFTGIAQQAAP